MLAVVDSQGVEGGGLVEEEEGSVVDVRGGSTAQREAGGGLSCPLSSTASPDNSQLLSTQIF